MMKVFLLLLERQISLLPDKHHGQIVTGDLIPTSNTKFRCLLSKRPNYKEPNTISYSKCKITVDSSIDGCIEKLRPKY